MFFYDRADTVGIVLPTSMNLKMLNCSQMAASLFLIESKTNCAEEILNSLKMRN